MITGIFMASGFSQRMGQNKLLLPFRGKPLFQHGLEAACASSLDRCLVVTNQDELMAFCKEQDIPTVFNSLASEGQSASIRLGVGHTPPESSFLFLTADQPFLTAAVIDRVIASAGRHPGKIIVPKYRNTPGSPTIFPHTLREELLGLTGDVRGGRIIQKHGSLVHYTELTDGLPLTDIDTPEDYAGHLK